VQAPDEAWGGKNTNCGQKIFPIETLFVILSAAQNLAFLKILRSLRFLRMTSSVSLKWCRRKNSWHLLDLTDYGSGL
jgi:hypothetical protein